jgi:cystathionine beta-synthase
MVSVSPTDTLMTAYKRMRASDVSQLPVLTESKLVGVLDEEDVLFSVSQNKQSFARTVDEFMTRQLDIVMADASEADLIDVLRQGKVAIIYQGDVFVGFITRVDLINHYKTQLD